MSISNNSQTLTTCLCALQSFYRHHRRRLGRFSKAKNIDRSLARPISAMSAKIHPTTKNGHVSVKTTVHGVKKTGRVGDRTLDLPQARIKRRCKAGALPLSYTPYSICFGGRDIRTGLSQTLIGWKYGATITLY